MKQAQAKVKAVEKPDHRRLLVAPGLLVALAIIKLVLDLGLAPGR